MLSPLLVYIQSNQLMILYSEGLHLTLWNLTSISLLPLELLLLNAEVMAGLKIFPHFAVLYSGLRRRFHAKIHL